MDSDSIIRYLAEDGSLERDPPEPIDSELLRRMITGMLRLRILDDRMLKLQRQGRIGFYGPATGQEAAVIGSALALEPDDWVFPALREGGVALERGYRLEDLIHQVLGTRKDILKGRQMPCHYSDRRVHQVSWSSCIGNQLPQAVGAAMAARRLQGRAVIIAYLGDGAASEGDFHVAANFAGVFRVPVVFFCQNNQWAISVPASRQTAAPSIAVKAKAYGFPGVRVDGNDILAVYTVTRAALARARSDAGPTLIEAVTYRMSAHSTSDDPTRYRDPEETALWERRDPIRRFRAYLTARNLWNDTLETEFRNRFQQELQETLAHAESESPPDLATLFEDVYRDPPWHLQEQQTAMLAYSRERSRWIS